MYSYAFLILLLPFLSFLLLGLLGMKMPKKVAGYIGTALMLVVVCLCYYTAYQYFFGVGREASGLYPTVTAFNLTWLDFGKSPIFGIDLLFKIGFRLTPISTMMLLVITTVSLMVHIYSFGYMAERDENYQVEGYEKGFQRFYAFLSLFTMSMLGLVVATNIFQMYLFWELVGVCSYMLIGFYYPKHAAVHASKKAFIVTRFADLFFLFGILIYSYYAGTFNYDLGVMPELANNLTHMQQTASWLIPTALFLMFIGGAGKSAMFPLHIWLPDAMEGPTPVSALIHAATMVVAGVYQVASLFPIYVKFGAVEQLHWIAYIAAFTAFYAAAVACAQADIKRGLAFSTISQIAYMLVALGVCFALDNHHGGLGYMAVPPLHPRHVQGVALPLLRCHHRDRGQQLLPVYGWAAQVHAYHQCVLPHRLPRHRGHSAFQRFLLQGRDHRRLLPVLPIPGLVHDGGGWYDGVLYVPPLLPHLLG